MTELPPIMRPPCWNSLDSITKLLIDHCLFPQTGHVMPFGDILFSLDIIAFICSSDSFIFFCFNCGKTQYGVIEISPVMNCYLLISITIFSITSNVSLNMNG